MKRNFLRCKQSYSDLLQRMTSQNGRNEAPVMSSFLKHKEKGTICHFMRRDKTLKICANHYITPMMELKPNAGSDRAWVWNTHADFADECPKPELLAIRFLNAENAQKFKTKFEECRKETEEREKKGPGKNDNAEKVAEKLEALSVREAGGEAEEKSEEKQ
ncbi:ran-specific GTPase-activating protein [Sigmodon hispidus]